MRGYDWVVVAYETKQLDEHSADKTEIVFYIGPVKFNNQVLVK